MKCRKLFSFVTAGIIALSGTTVFAASPEQAFTDAVLATGKKIASEQAIIDAKVPVNKIIGELSKSSMKVDAKFSMDSMPSTHGMGPASVSVSNKANINFLQRYLTNATKLSYKEGFVNVEADVNLYISNERVAVQVPQAYDKYISLKTVLSEEEWNATPIGKVLSDNDVPYQVIKVLTFDKLVNSSLATMDKKQSEALMAPYVKLFDEFIASGDIEANGAEEISSSTGAIATQKYTANYSTEDVANFINNVAKTLRDDTKAKELLRSTIDSNAQTLNLTELSVDEVMDQMCTSLEELADTIKTGAPDGAGFIKICYAINVNAEGLIVRNTFVVGTDDETDSSGFVVQIDTKGKEYLSNEIVFSFNFNDGIDDYGFALTNIGNAVPNSAGIIDGKMTVSVNGGPYSPFTENPLAVDYTWDTTKTNNNFTLGIYYNPELKFEDFDMDSEDSYGYYGQRNQKVDINAVGDVSVSESGKTIKMNFDDVTVKYSPKDELKFAVAYEISQGGNTNIGFTDSNSVELTELSETQLQQLTEKMGDNLLNAFGEEIEAPATAAPETAPAAE